MSPETLELEFVVEHGSFRLAVAESLPLAGVTAVFGPSGGGKSTLLRAIAGFDAPQQGRIAYGADLWLDRAAGVDLAAHRRPVGMMFQDARLFPHRDVAGNLAFAARRARRSLPGIDRDAVVEALDLGALLGRPVGGLSGGERQRVALARTLLGAPRLLLLDEPLAALDRVRKAEILPYLQALQGQFRIPTLYVSHDLDEVTRLADRMLVLADGRVPLHGDVAAVVERLGLEPAAEPFEASVLVDGTVLRHDARLHLTYVDLAGDALTLPMLERLAVGQPVRLRIRARDVAVAVVRPQGLSIRNVIAGTLAELVPHTQAGFADVKVQLAGTHVRARLTQAAVEDLDLRPGLPVYALIKSMSFEGAA